MLEALGRFARRNPFWAWFGCLLSLPAVVAFTTFLMLAKHIGGRSIDPTFTKQVVGVIDWLWSVQIGTACLSVAIGLYVTPRGWERVVQQITCLLSIPVVFGFLWVCKWAMILTGTSW